MSRIRSLMLLAATALVGVALATHEGKLPSLVSVAEAASKWQATLTSTDAGPTNVVCLSSPYQTIRLESIDNTPYCYKTCTSSTCVPDCLKDFRVNKAVVDLWTPDSGVTQAGFSVYNAQRLYTDPIPMGTDKCVVAIGVDGGSNPGVRVFLETQNPK